MTIPFEIYKQENIIDSKTNLINHTEQDSNFSIENENKQVSVLLVEDNTINQLLAQTVLNGLGYKVTTVENGLEATEIVEKEKFDIILMDLMMPIMDGYEASEKIRKSENNQINALPIIALTTDVTNSVKEKCNNIGINDYISKPFDSSKLNEKIIELIND